MGAKLLFYYQSPASRHFSLLTSWQPGHRKTLSQLDTSIGDAESWESDSGAETVGNEQDSGECLSWPAWASLLECHVRCDLEYKSRCIIVLGYIFSNCFFIFCAISFLWNSPSCLIKLLVFSICNQGNSDWKYHSIWVFFVVNYWFLSFYHK